MPETPSDPQQSHFSIANPFLAPWNARWSGVPNARRPTNQHCSGSRGACNHIQHNSYKRFNLVNKRLALSAQTDVFAKFA